MTVATLPTRTRSQWAFAETSLWDSIVVADHPLLTEHAAMAQRFLLDAGRPTQIWATRIAAIAVVAQRRADSAPTIARRVAYCDVAAAANTLLILAEHLHGVVPDAEAQEVLAATPFATLTKV